MDKSKNNQTTDSSEVIRRLRAVTRRIERFFEERVESVQQALSQIDNTESAFDVTRRRSAQLDEERRQWELEKQAEITRLTRASEELAIAWQQLEQRQRDVARDESLERQRSRMVGNGTRPVLNSAGSNQPGDDVIAIGEMQQLQMQINQYGKRQR